jgi:hypothetical protein
MDMSKNKEESTNRINPDYFEYNSTYKKHVLRIEVNFPIGKSNINYIDQGTMRDKDERKNQRFLIHILPKPGIVEDRKSD